MTGRAVFSRLAAIAGLYGVICAGFWLFQERLVFLPGPAPTRTPRALGLPFEDVRIPLEERELHAWFLPAAPLGAADPAASQGPAATVLISHGNAGSIAHRLGLAQAFLELGFSVLLYDYAGYGKSTGTPSEQALYADGEAAYAWLRARGVDPGRIVLYGESLGSAVAVELAARHPCAALITESAFTSLPDMGAELYPFLPARWLSRMDFDNRAKVRSLDVPYLIVHSPQDELVPFEQARELHSAAGGPVRLLETAGGHNDGGFSMRPEWRAAVGDFLDGALARGDPPLR